VRTDEAEIGWDRVRARIKAEWDILTTVAHAGDEALGENIFGSDSQTK
jgi:hypothetical protein